MEVFPSDETPSQAIIQEVSKIRIDQAIICQNQCEESYQSEHNQQREKV